MKNVRTGLIRTFSLLALILITQNANSSATNERESVAEQLAQIMKSGQFDNSQLNNRFSFNGPTNSPSPFILGGTNAARNEYQEYTLLIFTDGRGNVTGLCGGSIIASDKLLTAAHCAQNRASTYFAIPGFYSFNDRITQNDLIQVSRAVDHPSYSPQGFDFDVAVMTLSRTTQVPVAKVVRGSNLFNGVQGTVIGTGLSATIPTPVTLDVLQQVAAPIISNDQCSSNYLRFAGVDLITSNMICAGFSDNGNGTCSGDSGGPLYVDIRGQRTIAGTASFGFATCENNRATNAYARISEFTDFIESQSPNTEFIASNSVSLAPIYSLLFDEGNSPSEPTPQPPLTARDIVPAIPEEFNGKYYINIQTIIDASVSFVEDSSYVYTQENSNTDFVNNFSDSIAIRIDGAGQLGVERINQAEDWTLNLSRPRLGTNQGRLTPGTYSDARRFPFNDFDNGLSLSGLGSGCNTLKGSFRIVEIEYTNDILTRLLADFQQRCDGSNREMIGSIDFDASREDAVLPPIELPQGSPSPTLPNGSTLIVEGSENTFILRDTLLLSTSDSTFSASSFNPNSSISISITTNGGNTRYSLEMRRSEFNIDPLRNSPLSAGVYENATRAAFSRPLAGLSFSGNGRGCNNSAGSFNIYEIMFDQSGELRKLVADFEQFCDGQSESIRGSIDLEL